MKQKHRRILFGCFLWSRPEGCVWKLCSHFKKIVIWPLVVKLCSQERRWWKFCWKVNLLNGAFLFSLLCLLAASAGFIYLFSFLLVYSECSQNNIRHIIYFSLLLRWYHNWLNILAFRYCTNLKYGSFHHGNKYWTKLICMMLKIY